MIFDIIENLKIDYCVDIKSNMISTISMECLLYFFFFFCLNRIVSRSQVLELDV